MKIIEDTREKLPLDFSGFQDVTVERGTVKVFDYCLEGDLMFAVERKSLSDFVGSLVTHSRHKRELAKIRKARQAGFPSIHYVVEATFTDLTDPATYSYNTKANWSLMSKRWRTLVYVAKCHVHFVSSAEGAAEAVYQLLKERNRELKLMEESF